jgi:hypothetical protein
LRSLRCCSLRALRGGAADGTGCHLVGSSQMKMAREKGGRLFDEPAGM